MLFLNRTASTLVSSLFLRPKIPSCSVNQTFHISTMSAPVVAVCHGGGPMPLLRDPAHAELIKSMSTIVPTILGVGTASAPRAIVIVTAHWTTIRPTISNGSKHKLLFDYSGFPRESYQLKYDAPGSPEVAKEIYDVFEKAGLQPEMDGNRGMQLLEHITGCTKISRLGSWCFCTINTHQSKRRYPSCPTLCSQIGFSSRAFRNGTCSGFSSYLKCGHHWFWNAYLP